MIILSCQKCGEKWETEELGWVNTIIESCPECNLQNKFSVRETEWEN